jgi:hypothetical protein
MSEKNGVPRENGELLDATRTSEGLPQNPHVSCGKAVLKYGGYYPRSPRRKGLNSHADECLCLLHAGETVTEDSITPGRFKGDSLRAMRQTARLHPSDCSLILNKGRWFLIPIMKVTK